LKPKKSLQIILLFGTVVLLCYSMYDDHDKTRTWSSYKGDAGTTSYSPLKEINKDNVANLEVAWKFSPVNATVPAAAAPGGFGGRGGLSQSNPIIIDGVLYNCMNKNKVYAVNASTGEQIWEYDPFKGGNGTGNACRGVTYWENGDDKRILTTIGPDLYALDAKTGQLITSFGKDGKVDMRVGLRDDPKETVVSATSPGAIYGDLIIMGSTVSEFYDGAPGYVRAYNVKTGKLVWTFHTIPQPGEYGYETWPKDAWKTFGGVNDWAGLSVDKKRGMVFLALGGASYDFYGVYRTGSDLFADCVVALDAKTGKHIWHFQTIHHDLWDYDLPAPPSLITITKKGRKIDAVAQVTKTGFLFVLDRKTGKSLFPIVERKVPKSRIPNEHSWPTQPFPLLPKPYSRQNLTEDDLSNFSPAAHDSLVKLFRSLRYTGLFSPPDVQGTMESPGTNGGADWGGGAFDPATNIYYVKNNDNPEISKMQKIEDAATNVSDFDAGKSIYMTYCVACHGKDKNGDEQNYPSLVNIQKKLTPEQIITKIKTGGGKMPAFQTIIKSKKEEAAILAYLSGNDNNAKTTNQVAAAPVKKGLAQVRYVNIYAYEALRDINHNPGIKPPWGTLNAIDLNTGQYVFKVIAGNNANLQKKGEPETGLTGNAGPFVTAGGLVFLTGGFDRKLKAYDKLTGKVLWETTLPGFANANPCTYMSTDGKQYVAVTTAGDKDHPNGYVVAYALKN
ncbi:MAG TPA: PQQ-binding-like beta-propeller repeat protein, partial [Mucilaginibacter sp.]